MPFCSNCGEPIETDTDYCPKCGSECNSGGHERPQSSDEKNEGSAWWFLVGLMFPPLGILIWLILHGSKPRSSKFAGIGVLTSFLLYAGPAFYLAMYDSFGEGDYDYTMTEINAYQDTNGYVELPWEGCVFIDSTVDITYNRNKSFSCNDFVLICDGKEYTYVAYDDYSVTVYKGGTGRLVVTYEVPDTFKTLSLKYKGDNNLNNKTGDITDVPKEKLVEESIFWDYKVIGTATSFVSIYSTTEYATSGFQFVIARVVEKNGSYDGLYEPYYSHFQLIVTDGNTYGYYTHSSFYSHDNDGLYETELSKGQLKAYYILFEIPLTVEPSSISFVRHSYDKFLDGRDDTLLA